MKAFLTESVRIQFHNRIKYILNRPEMYPITPCIYLTSATQDKTCQIGQIRLHATPEKYWYMYIKFRRLPSMQFFMED